MSKISVCLQILVAFNLLLWSNTLKSQERIHIKDGTEKFGHFNVELLHNEPGAPMKSYNENGDVISVSSKANKFILRLSNFVWYNTGENVELSFPINKIESKSDVDFSIDQESDYLTLKPISNYVRDIYFETEGYGQVKLLFKFNYNNDGKGQFIKEFRISSEKDDTVIQMNSSSSKSDNNDVDQIKVLELEIVEEFKKLNKESVSDLEKFIDKYDDKEYAQQFILTAKKLITIKKSNTVEKQSTAKEINTDNFDGKKVVDDINEITENTFNSDSDVKNSSVDLVNLKFNIEGKDEEQIIIQTNEIPLQLNLKTLGEKEFNLANSIKIPNFINDTIITIDGDYLSTLGIIGKFTSFNLINANGTEITSGIIDIDNNNNGSSSMQYVLGLCALFLVVAGLIFFNKKRNAEKQAKSKAIVEQKIKDNKANHPTKLESKGKIVIGNKKDDPTPQNSIPRSNSNITSVKKGKPAKIKIKSHKKNAIETSFAEFAEAVNTAKTVHIDLSKIWSDSTIHNVYLKSEYIQALDKFLAESSNEGIQNELQGAVPEVGGFMMGRHTNNKDHIDIFVEKFVPFVPEYNDVFKIEIGTKTVVDELGDAQDKYPDLNVIGWLHTHPGHGLFLSNSDLSVQKHFPENYQVAMEIDSLTKGLDMSIFTRQSGGRMNNSNDRISGMGWYQWTDIENSNK